MTFIRKFLTSVPVAFVMITLDGASTLRAQESGQKILGVITGDNVRARREPHLKPGGIQTLLFRGNVVEVIKTVHGDPVEGNDTWYYVHAGYYGNNSDRYYVHSSLLLEKEKAWEYIRQFDPQVHRKRFEKYFPNIPFGEIAKCFHLFYSENTLESFESLYRIVRQYAGELGVLAARANSYPPDFYYTGDENQPLLEIENLASALMPGLQFVSFSEEPEPHGDIHLYAMRDKAMRTKEKRDDRFIALMIESYDWGVLNRNPAWFSQTWDLGGYTNLGVGFLPGFMKKLDNYPAENNFLTSEISNIKNEIVSLLTRFHTFGGTQKDCLAELNEIIKNIKLTRSQRDELHKLIEFIKKEPQRYHFNCKNIRCSYG